MPTHSHIYGDTLELNATDARTLDTLCTRLQSDRTMLVKAQRAPCGCLTGFTTLRMQRHTAITDDYTFSPSMNINTRRYLMQLVLAQPMHCQHAAH